MYQMPALVFVPRRGTSSADAPPLVSLDRMLLEPQAEAHGFKTHYVFTNGDNKEATGARYCLALVTRFDVRVRSGGGCTRQHLPTGRAHLRCRFDSSVRLAESRGGPASVNVWQLSMGEY